VGIGADAVAFAVFAVVEVLVLVAQDGQRGPVRQFIAAAQLGYRGGLHVLVGQRKQGNRHPDHGADLRAPEAGAGDNDVGRNDPFGGLNAGNPPSGLLDARHGGGAAVLDARGFGALDQQLHGTSSACQAIAWHVEAAQDVFVIEERVELLALGGGEDPSFDSPGGCIAQLALEVGEPGFGGGDFQAAHLVEAADAVLCQGQQLFHGVLGERRHGLGRVGLEDQARSMGGGSAGHVQRPLVQDCDVVPSPGDQFVGQVRADDAGSDDDNSWRRCHVVLLLI
jgi:hypothetical protein